MCGCAVCADCKVKYMVMEVWLIKLLWSHWITFAAQWSVSMRKLSYEVGRGRCVFYSLSHDDVIKWKPFPRYWPFVRGIHRWPVISPLKGQWQGTLMFSLICTWINRWVNTSEAGDLRRHRAHYDNVMYCKPWWHHDITTLSASLAQS